MAPYTAGYSAFSVIMVVTYGVAVIIDIIYIICFAPDDKSSVITRDIYADAEFF